jgi:hypothetical protein
MVASLEKVDPTLPHKVDNPVFLRESTRPGSRRQILQRFRLSHADERVPQNGLDQG